MRKTQFLVNLISVTFVLFVNYYSQTGGINNQTVGDLSDRYDNLFTPAGYAFAIWGIIFLGMLIFVIFQGVALARTSTSLSFFDRVGFLFAWVNLGNGLWVVAWLFEYTFLSVLIMTGMLVGLATILTRCYSLSTRKTAGIRAFAWWPLAIYSGWIAVATIANISAYLSKLDWTGGFLSEASWTIIMIAAAVVVNALVTWKRSTSLFSAVGIWALYAIHVRHQGTYETIATTAIIGVAALAINLVVKAALDLKTKKSF